jgi:hypothetical protein
MTTVLARTTSVLGILALAGGIMTAACSAPPAGSIGTGEQDQTDNDDDGKLPATSTSSTDPAKTNNNTPAPASQNTPTPATPSPTPDAGTVPTPTPAPNTCGATTDFFACIDCCDQANPGGFEVDGQAWDNCICQTACAQACGGNFCNGGDPSLACEQCMDNAQQCDQVAETACQGNAACAAAMTCVQSSQCEAKP